jgi:hypothetical protein
VFSVRSVPSYFNKDKFRTVQAPTARENVVGWVGLSLEVKKSSVNVV